MALELSAQGPDVVISGAESLTLDGQGGLDSLTITTSDANELIRFAPGRFSDAGSILVQDLNPGPEQLLPIAFEDLGNVGSTVNFLDGGAEPGDVLVVSGTDNHDAFTVASSGEVTIENSAEAPISPTINTAGIAQLILQGLEGNDSFEIDGDHPFAGEAGIVIEGGDPGQVGDLLEFIGSGAGAVDLDLAAQSVGENGFGDVHFTGIEKVNIDANAALTVVGTDANDVFDVTPTGAGNDGSLLHDGSSIAYHYTDATTITIDGENGDGDQLNLHATEGANVITATTDTITVDGSTVTLGDGVESLSVNALGGDDSVDLSNLEFTGTITISGGDGDDTLIGTDQADVIFGGTGNDILIGRDGADAQYGEDGNDLFGNPGLDADATADDPGADQNFGGNGVDIFVWEPGDGEDVNSGGSDGGDIFRFFGSDAVDSLALQSGDAPTHLRRPVQRHRDHQPGHRRRVCRSVG